MTTVEEVLDALQNGRARLRYTVTDEAWYAPATVATRDPHVKREIMVGVDAVREDGGDDGCFGEWSIQFLELGGSPSALHRQFGEEMAAFRAADTVTNYLTELTGVNDPSAVRAILTRIGFEDRTERRDPDGNRPLTLLPSHDALVASILATRWPGLVGSLALIEGISTATAGLIADQILADAEVTE